MNKRARTRLIVVTVAILALVGVLIWRNSGSSSVYKTPSEILSEASSLTGRSVRVAGFVVPGSIKREAAGTSFRVGDPDKKDVTLAVFYTGTVPGTFKDEADVVVDGELGADGKVSSDTMITKCPTKFEDQAGKTQASGSQTSGSETTGSETTGTAP